MATTVWPAAGTTLSYSTDSGSTWIDLAEVISISNPGGGKVGERDTTNLASTAKTSMPTIPDNGEVSFEINYDPTDTGHQQLSTWKETPPSTLPEFKVTFATGVSPKTATFSGFVNSFEPNAGGVEDNLQAAVTIRVSGPVTYA